MQAPEMTTKPGRNRRHAESEKRRQRILEAARQGFGQLGFAKATVDSIASEAGVSNGLLYQFFRNKEHLFEVVIGELLRDWARAISLRDQPEPATAGEALEATFRASVEFARANPLLPKLLSEDAQLQLERFRLVGKDRVEPHRQWVAGILERGVAAGEFRADLDVPALADVICQLQSDYANRAYRRDPLHPATRDLIDAAIRLIAAGLRP
ncbi:MAG: TetR/AcrR family transcriptional regulator [Myxococcales bacterium]|nr:TetR/AcrR family transcriptional regulator [Myxococcales bacterium]